MEEVGLETMGVASTQSRHDSYWAYVGRAQTESSSQKSSTIEQQWAQDCAEGGVERGTLRICSKPNKVYEEPHASRHKGKGR